MKDAGYLAAKLISATVHRVRCDLSLKKLLPLVCSVIDENVHESIGTQTNPDQELLFNMLILQEVWDFVFGVILCEDLMFPGLNLVSDKL